MKFGSVCSGIEAASVAWNPLGWQAAWFSEIEPFPCALLRHHYPYVANLGDMTSLPKRILKGEVEAPDIFCGGTPCQAFSVAGKRKSLEDARGNLSLVFCQIANAIDTARTRLGLSESIIFWENVPGVLSTKDNAFGCFLAELVGADAPLSPGSNRWPCAGAVAGPTRRAAWRILDAQHFGVPQRRRRVFVVASARKEFDPAKILFESEGLCRDSETCGQAREGTPAFAEGSFGSFRECDGLSGTLKASGGVLSGGSETLVVGTLTASDASKQFTNNQSVNNGMLVIEESRACYPIDTMNITERKNGSNGFGIGNSGDPSFTLSRAHCHGVATEHQVRRLTPVECERLQGFPDNYTRIPWRNKEAEQCPDAPRYKAIGNSWAVPVVRWIGQRIKESLK